jgi:RNA polymerase sigma-70 factor (ECF subfamily)
MLGPPFDDVLDGAQSGDPLAFGELWRDAQPMLLRYLRVMVDDRAEDVASFTWLRVIEGLGTFRGGEPGFRRRLVTVARNHAIDVVHRERRHATEPVGELEDVGTELFGLAPDPVDVVAGRLSTRAALDLIGRLPRHQAELVMLRVLLDLDVADVADVTGRTPGSVRVAVHRALCRLEGMLTRELVGVAPSSTRRSLDEMTTSHHRTDGVGDVDVADVFMAGRNDVLPADLDALFCAVAAPVTTDELAGAEAAVAAFLAVGPGSPAMAEAQSLREEAASLRLHRRAVAVVATSGLLLTGVSAAYAGRLPQAVQRVAHTVIAAPAPAVDLAGGTGAAVDEPSTDGADWSASTTSSDPTSTDPTSTDALGAAAYGLCTAWSHAGLPANSNRYADLEAAAGGADQIAGYCDTTTPGGTAGATSVESTDPSAATHPTHPANPTRPANKGEAPTSAVTSTTGSSTSSPTRPATGKPTKKPKS